MQSIEALLQSTDAARMIGIRGRLKGEPCSHAKENLGISDVSCVKIEKCFCFPGILAPRENNFSIKLSLRNVEVTRITLVWMPASCLFIPVLGWARYQLAVPL